MILATVLLPEEAGPSIAILSQKKGAVAQATAPYLITFYEDTLRKNNSSVLSFSLHLLDSKFLSWI